MTIKRKTHLNLSGSHHTLDSDNAFIGGLAYITGSLTASIGVSGSLVQGTTGLFTKLSASISGTVAGNPFIVAGPNITANYNSLGQWTITGSAGGGTNFWTEIDSSNIYTTSSIEVARISASLGAILTGSVRITGSVSQGAFTVSTGIESFAHGYNVNVSGDYAHGEGVNTTATGNYSHVEGTGTTASGASSHAEGDNTLAQGDASHTEGQYTRTTITGQWAHAEGYMTTGSAQYAHAEGRLSLASGQYSHAEGSATVASSFAAHSEGLFSTASNDGAHSEGYGTTASGYVAHSEGHYSIASGDYSHAEGDTTTASGNYSHAEGSGSIASGKYSHAEGISTLAIGTGSFAAGLQTIANGTIDGTDPPTIVQAVFGKFNQNSNTTSLFVVGDGLNNANRHDVLRVNSGSVQVTGSLIAPHITGSLSGTVAGNPFIVAGSNITANYNSLGQWEITGSAGGGTPAGSNTQIQFNQDGTSFAAVSELTFNTASVGSLTPYTLSAPTGSLKVLSGSNTDNLPLLGGSISDPYLLINSAVIVTQSAVFFDGGFGIAAVNGAAVRVASSSAGGDGFTIQPDQSGNGKIDLLYEDPDANYINLRPLYATMSAVSPNGIAGTPLSGTLITSNFKTFTVGKIDFTVLAGGTGGASDNYASWTFSVTARQNGADVFEAFAVTELDSAASGTLAATWDVNVNSDGTIQCTGSSGDTVRWYGQVTKKMILDSSATPFIVY